MSVVPVCGELVRAAEAVEEFADQLRSEGVDASALYGVAALIAAAAEEADRGRGSIAREIAEATVPAAIEALVGVLREASKAEVHEHYNVHEALAGVLECGFEHRDVSWLHMFARAMCLNCYAGPHAKVIGQRAWSAAHHALAITNAMYSVHRGDGDQRANRRGRSGQYLTNREVVWREYELLGRELEKWERAANRIPSAKADEVD